MFILAGVSDGEAETHSKATSVSSPHLLSLMGDLGGVLKKRRQATKVTCG